MDDDSSLPFLIISSKQPAGLMSIKSSSSAPRQLVTNATLPVATTASFRQQTMSASSPWQHTEATSGTRVHKQRRHSSSIPGRACRRSSLQSNDAQVTNQGAVEEVATPPHHSVIKSPLPSNCNSTDLKKVS